MRKPLHCIIFLLSISFAKAQPGSSTLIISQIYGDGGSSGSTYSNDFIEIYNHGSTTINLSNYSIQYAAGANWSMTPLTAVLLQPGKYYLIKQASNGSGGSALPFSEATGSVTLHSNSGKVALVSSQTLLSNGCTSSPDIVDLVGYGNVTCNEGSPAGGGSNTLSIIRKAGNLDTDNNTSDFTTGPPTPRNGLFTLPIHFNDFSAQKKGNANELTWLINCTSSSAKIDLQRSATTTDFKNIYTLTASRERCSAPFTYNDLNFSGGTNYYRLKVTDASNTTKFSNVIIVNNKTMNHSLSINYLDITNVSLNYYSPAARLVKLFVIDQAGRVVTRISKNVMAGKNLITVPISSLRPGAYTISGSTVNPTIPFVKF